MRLTFAVIACLVPASAGAGSIDWARVGDPGNAPDTVSNCYSVNCGSVPYRYFISKYEVTNAQYEVFLESVASEQDPYGLYDRDMEWGRDGGIIRRRIGFGGDLIYRVKPGYENKPVNYITFWDAIRYANWLNNGMGHGDTETGAYTITPEGIAANSITRNPGATSFLPNENEWYKAAYYDGLSARYFDYPAGSDMTIGCSASPTAAPNHANCSPSNFPQPFTDAGAFTGSPSPYGTFDQGGNIWEWTETVDPLRTNRVTRGCSSGCTAEGLSSSSKAAFPPTFRQPNFGFRVASIVPEPHTAVLVMAGLAGLAARRREAGL